MKSVNYVAHHRSVYFKMSEDDRLSPYHLSVYNALFMLWNECGFADKLSINRNDVMRLSKIGNQNTYTKVLKQLHDYGYIVYEPSFNPLKGSLVTIIRCDKGSDKGSVKGGSKGGDKGGDTLYKQENNETLENRKKDFASLLQPYVEKYGREMLNEFYFYWTEPNQRKTKMKFEMEKTWSIERRLNTWSKQSVKFGTAVSKAEKPKFDPYG